MEGEVGQRASGRGYSQTSQLHHLIWTQWPKVEGNARDLVTFGARRQDHVDDAFVGIGTGDPEASGSAPNTDNRLRAMTQLRGKGARHPGHLGVELGVNEKYSTLQSPVLPAPYAGTDGVVRHACGSCLRD